MKKLGLAALLCLAYSINLHAQVIDDVNGKTYYYYGTGTDKKIKEIFHHIQEFRTSYDNQGNTHDTILYIKNGPYTRYYENGKLDCSGFYTKEQKSGTWKYYSQAGKLIKTEEWTNGQLIRSTRHS
jgi:antitoxin component YwqK of YwqJK toxin-antitoxin module